MRVQNIINKREKYSEEIGWTQQADMLFKEIDNVHHQKTLYERRIANEQAKQTRLQQEYQSREDQLREEQEEKQRKIESERNKLSPELQRKVDTAQMVLEKAQELEQKEKWDKALSRYEYLVELYNELGISIISQNQIDEVQSKIEELRGKLPESAI